MQSDLNLEHEQLHALINSMADGVVAVDSDGKIMLYNGAALNILDVNAIAQGDQVSKVMQLHDTAGKELQTDKLITATKTQTISRDYTLKYADESVANIYLSISPVHLGYGKQRDSGFVLIIRDITREKSLEEERDEFISVISHELRTPVAVTEGAVGNALYIAENTGDLDKIKASLKGAHEQAQYLENMINDLSTLSRAERGVLESDVEDINVHDFTEQLMHAYAPQAERKDLQLHIDIDTNLTLLRSVKLYVQEILQNYITNAIKYTEEGSVTIEAKARDNGVEFAVIDTGIGISKGDQSRVFDKFFRSEDFKTREQNGTGLGLHVTKKLASLAKAEIQLESTLNKGSTFKIYFPNLSTDTSGKNDS